MKSPINNNTLPPPPYPVELVPKEANTTIIHARPPPIKSDHAYHRSESIVSAPGNLQQDELDTKTSASPLSNGASFPLPVKNESCRPSIESNEPIDLEATVCALCYNILGDIISGIFTNDDRDY
jgi:hypothetical protein